MNSCGCEVHKAYALLCAEHETTPELTDDERFSMLEAALRNGGPDVAAWGLAFIEASELMERI